MHVSFKPNEIMFHVDPASDTSALDEVYLQRFDGATVKFVSNQEGDKLVISVSE